MIRLCLPAALFLAAPAQSEELRLPGQAGEPAATECRAVPGDPDSCVRVLACVGDAGVYFDGKAKGWDEGSVSGQLSDGTVCQGHWDSRGPFNTGRSWLSCEGGLDVNVLYFSQDPQTGTVIGSGKVSDGRSVQVWSGKNVLKFLTEDGAVSARLPCGGGDILISGLRKATGGGV